MPNWRRSAQKLRLPSLDTVEMSSKRVLEPTLVNPIEIAIQVDLPTDHSHPIGVSKKNAWNPNPSWRADAGWPTNQHRTELRPITIEKIPEAFPLSSRLKSFPPVVRDTVQQSGQASTVTLSKVPSASPSAGIVPWSSFVDESESVARKVIQNREPMQNAGLGHTVSIGHEVHSEAFKPPILPSTELQLDGPVLSPVESQRFIRQPNTRR